MPEDLRKQYREFIEGSSSARILSDGSLYDVPYLRNGKPLLRIYEYDPLEFYRQVDIFASEYGLGGCRSLTEFAKMIDEEDPELINGLMFAMQERNDPEAYKKEQWESNAKSGGTRRSVRSKDGRLVNEADMSEFLANSGIPVKEIKEAKKRLAARKINIEEQQEREDWIYKNITPENLQDPNFDMKKAQAELSAYFDNTEKFNISASTIFGKK